MKFKMMKIFLKKQLIYLTESNREDGLPNDPVARFHLGNGAILHKINLQCRSVC